MVSIIMKYFYKVHVLAIMKMLLIENLLFYITQESVRLFTNSNTHKDIIPSHCTAALLQAVCSLI